MFEEQREKVKNWFEHVNKSYKIALAVIIILSIGATVYWAYVRDQWGTQMVTDVLHRYKCVFNGLAASVTSCVGETVPGDSAVA